MTPENDAKPIRCEKCSQPLRSPICCESCGALNPVPLESFNYFEMFSLKPDFDVDVKALHRKYLSLSRNVHPDVACGESADGCRGEALAVSSELNRAYDTLKNPVSRAEYLLSLAMGSSATEDRSVPADVLEEVMTLREELENARLANDQQVLIHIRDRAAQRSETLMNEIADLCRALMKPDEAGMPAIRCRLRQRLNAIKYWNNMLDKLPTGPC